MRVDVFPFSFFLVAAAPSNPNPHTPALAPRTERHCARPHARDRDGREERLRGVETVVGVGIVVGTVVVGAVAGTARPRFGEEEDVGERAGREEGAIWFFDFEA